MRPFITHLRNLSSRSPFRFPRPNAVGTLPNAVSQCRCASGGGLSDPTRDRSSRKTLVYLLGLVGAMVGASYAAVPLYRRFCQATGYGGTVNRREVSFLFPLLIFFLSSIVDSICFLYFPWGRLCGWVLLACSNFLHSCVSLKGKIDIWFSCLNWVLKCFHLWFTTKNDSLQTVEEKIARHALDGTKNSRWSFFSLENCNWDSCSLIDRF